MKNILITESQLKSIQEMHINGESLYYDNTQILNEEWWNTLGDVVGIFDPTGVVDLVNGIDYVRQGEYFFGFLSMISIIPYVGDAIAKPIIIHIQFVACFLTFSIIARRNIFKSISSLRVVSPRSLIASQSKLDTGFLSISRMIIALYILDPSLTLYIALGSNSWTLS